MFDTVINYLSSFQWNSGVVVCFYWWPVVANLMGYTMKCMREYERDLSACKLSPYFPTLTVGGIIGRLIVSVIPFINIFPAFKHSIVLSLDILSTLGHWLDIPLVRHKPVPKEK